MSNLIEETYKTMSNKGFTYIARDYNGDLFLYKQKPIKKETSWYTPSLKGFISITELEKNSKVTFPVKWSDKEPYCFVK